MNRPKVLIIDDDPSIRSLISFMLRRDYLAFLAADGKEGFRKALENPPQLVIIDIEMPGWNGLRTLEAFRANQYLSQIPIMMLTADATRATVATAIEKGANDYVIKSSLDKDELLTKALRLIRLGPSCIGPRATGTLSAVSAV